MNAPFERIFSAWEQGLLRDLEVVRGVLHPGLHADHPDVVRALRAWPGTRYWRATPRGAELTLVRRAVARPRERWWLHALLLLGTLFTATLAGAFLAGWEPSVWATWSVGPLSIPVPGGWFLPELGPGLWFSVPMVAILLAHESGHYALARRHGMDASPPWFIPAPYQLSLIGSFGAVIRLRSPVVNRAVLLDVGAAGPLAGMALAVPAAAAGLLRSVPRPDLLLPPDAASRFVLTYGAEPAFSVGSSLGFELLAWAFAPGPGPLVLHPLAVAGWIGFFFTALNLLPVSQLDGGHVLYALFGPVQRWVGVGFLGVLVALGWLWQGWWIWAVLILLLGRGTVRHPSVWDPAYPVRGARRVVAWACIVLFALTFIPTPFVL